MSLGGILGQSVEMPDNLVLAQQSGGNYTGVLTDLLGAVVPVVASSVSNGCKISVGTAYYNSSTPTRIEVNFIPQIIFTRSTFSGNDLFEMSMRVSYTLRIASNNSYATAIYSSITQWGNNYVLIRFNFWNYSGNIDYIIIGV